MTKLSRAIVRTPGLSFVEGLTTADLGAPDYERARKQHEAYCAALEACGLALTRLEADERYPDSTFVEDTAVLTKRCAIITRPGAASRIGEVKRITKVLARFFSEVQSVREPGTLDGGDVCEAGNHFFIGISERTNEAGAQQLAEMLRSLGYTSTLLDIRGQKEKVFEAAEAKSSGWSASSPGILHLKSGLAYLGDNRLVVIEALANYREFRGYDLVRVRAGEEYVANCVRVNGDVLVAGGYSEFAGTLRDLSYQTLELDTTEFQKMDGGLSCLSLRF